MTSRLLLSFSLALLAWQRAGAQLAPAADFFNSGAQFYISNNVPAALERVELGRKLYPEDEKLKKLEELLKQQQQDQQNQSQQPQQKDQQSQPQNQQSPQNHAQDQPKPDGQKQAEPQMPAEPENGSADKADEEKPNREGQPVQPGQLTPEEAKKLLDAQKSHEQLLQWKPPEKPHDRQRPLKDW